MNAEPVKPPPVMFEPLHLDVLPPERATGGAPGFDLRAYLVERRVRCSDGAVRATTDRGGGFGRTGR